MKAMILAAGLGKRMRPLTNNAPKPLLRVGGKCLIEYHLENVAAAGITEVVINTHWLAQQIPAALGDGSRWGLTIHYSHEPEVLETAGGICQALPLLLEADGLETKGLETDSLEKNGSETSVGNGDQFLVINGDVYTEINLNEWIANLPTLSEQRNAHLSLVNNPDHNPEGDFGFNSDTGFLSTKGSVHPSYTYSGLSVFHRSFFQGLARGRAPLGPMLRKACQQGTISASLQSDYWMDVGTPERLEELRQRLSVS